MVVDLGAPIGCMSDLNLSVGSILRLSMLHDLGFILSQEPCGYMQIRNNRGFTSSAMRRITIVLPGPPKTIDNFSRKVL